MGEKIRTPFPGFSMRDHLSLSISSTIKILRPVSLEFGQTRSFLTESSTSLGKLKKSEIFWEFTKPRWTHCLWWCDKNLYLKNVTVTSNTNSEYV